MKKSLSILTAATLALALVSCGSRESSTVERSPGEMAFRASCQNCHTLPRPTMKSAKEWPELVARYGERASLTADKIAAIAEYLMASTNR